VSALKLVLFDIDGTLIDTGGAGARSWTWAFEHAFERPGVDIGKYSSAGMTDPVVARKTFTEALGREPSGEELARLMSAYLSVLPDYVAASEGYRVLPGVAELLPKLSKANVLLGVTTGALEAGAHAKLGRARLNHYFLVGGYGSDSENRVRLTQTAVERAERLLGRSLQPREVAVVGDTPLDISAAQGAGVVSIGVASGRYGVEELRASGAEHVLSSLAESFPGV
jgi:phosphoglycolate phosphatase